MMLSFIPAHLALWGTALPPQLITLSPTPAPATPPGGPVAPPPPPPPSLPPLGEPLPEEAASSNTVVMVVFALVMAGLVYYFFSLAMAKRRREEELKLSPPAPPAPVKIRPGWYPTPDDLQERYFDGEEWTENFRPRAEAATPAPQAPASPRTSTAGETSESESVGEGK